MYCHIALNASIALLPLDHEHDRRDEEREDDRGRPARRGRTKMRRGQLTRRFPPSPRSCTSRARRASPSAGSSVGDDPPSQDDEQRSDSPISSSRSAETSSTARPFARGPDGCSPTPRPAHRRRCRGSGATRSSSFGLAEHLAADDELLLVAARQRVRGDVDARRADVELLDDLLGRAHEPRAGRSRHRSRTAACV